MRIRQMRQVRWYVESPKFKTGHALRDYQIQGINWLINAYMSNRNGILADEMGLGKTIQCVAFLEHLRREEGVRGPFLIVAPLSTLTHWKREAESWTDMNTIVYHDASGGSNGRRILRDYEFYYEGTNILKFNILITSYEMLLTDFLYLEPIKWKYLIVDEGHRLKNKTARLMEAFDTLQIPRRLLLTGTPIQNNTTELWTLLNFVEPTQFSSIKDFHAKFKELNEVSQVEQLQKAIAKYILRRMKETVEKSIPPKEETIIDVELTVLQKKYYRAIYERNAKFLRTGLTVSNMPRLINIVAELRKCCNHPWLVSGTEEKEVPRGASDADYMALTVQASGKMVLLDKLLPKLREEGHRVLIFSQMVMLLDILEDYMRHRQYKYERLDGTIMGDQREAAIDRFCRPDSDRFVFLLSTRAGGVGLNLTRADTVIIFDSDWNPQMDVQAQARAHRIGQKNAVSVYRLVTRNTYESQMFARASKKLGLDHAVLRKLEVDSGGQLHDDERKDIDKILKLGAYGLLDEEEDDQHKTFFNADIDVILEKNTHIITNKRAGGEGAAQGAVGGLDLSTGGQPSIDPSIAHLFENAQPKKPDGPVVPARKPGRPRKQQASVGGLVYSKQYFSAEGSEESKLDINDANFWARVLGQHSEEFRYQSDNLLSRLTDGSAIATEAARQNFFDDLKEGVQRALKKKAEGEELPDSDEWIALLVHFIALSSTFPDKWRSQAQSWLDDIEARSVRRARMTQSNLNESRRGGKKMRGAVRDGEGPRKRGRPPKRRSGDEDEDDFMDDDEEDEEGEEGEGGEDDGEEDASGPEEDDEEDLEDVNDFDSEDDLEERRLFRKLGLGSGKRGRPRKYAYDESGKRIKEASTRRRGRPSSSIAAASGSVADDGTGTGPGRRGPRGGQPQYNQFICAECFCPGELVPCDGPCNRGYHLKCIPHTPPKTGTLSTSPFDNPLVPSRTVLGSQPGSLDAFLAYKPTALNEGEGKKEESADGSMSDTTTSSSEGRDMPDLSDPNASWQCPECTAGVWRCFICTLPASTCAAHAEAQQEKEKKARGRRSAAAKDKEREQKEEQEQQAAARKNLETETLSTLVDPARFAEVCSLAEERAKYDFGTAALATKPGDGALVTLGTVVVAPGSSGAGGDGNEAGEGADGASSSSSSSSSTSPSGVIVKTVPARFCAVASCGRVCHGDCAPRLASSRLVNKNETKALGGLSGYRCGSHFCDACVGDDGNPDEADGSSRRENTVISCLTCPTGFHTKCLPEQGVIRLTRKLMFCPRCADVAQKTELGRKAIAAADVVVNHVWLRERQSVQKKKASASKEEKKLRAEERIRRKEERAAERAAQAEHKKRGKKSKSGNDSDDYDEDATPKKSKKGGRKKKGASSDSEDDRDDDDEETEIDDDDDHGDDSEAEAKPVVKKRRKSSKASSKSSSLAGAGEGGNDDDEFDIETQKMLLDSLSHADRAKESKASKEKEEKKEKEKKPRKSAADKADKPAEKAEKKSGDGGEKSSSTKSRSSASKKKKQQADGDADAADAADAAAAEPSPTGGDEPRLVIKLGKKRPREANDASSSSSTTSSSSTFSSSGAGAGAGAEDAQTGAGNE